MNAGGVMDNIRNAFDCWGMTLNQLGEGLVYRGPTTTKQAWFLLHRSFDLASCRRDPGCQDK